MCCPLSRPLMFFFFNDTATTEIYTLSLHDALPIWLPAAPRRCPKSCETVRRGSSCRRGRDRKSTRLNSSHMSISYAVFCLKKKNRQRSTHYESIHEHLFSGDIPRPDPAVSRIALPP